MTVTPESASRLHLPAGKNLSQSTEFQTHEYISPETASKVVKKMSHCLSGVGRNTAVEKPLFAVRGSNNDSGMDENDNVPASWEDIEDAEFPWIKLPATATSSSDCCSDGDDWFNVKPGQLEAAKWSMKLHKQAVTPPVQCTWSVAKTAASFSAPAAPRTDSSDRKKKPLFSRFRPGMDEDEEVDWSQQFKLRYEKVKLPFFDSHCHLDFLFKRSGFRGSFAKYRQQFANTFPSSFAGCVSVFCNPKLWDYESEGKIFVLLFWLCVI